MSIFKIKTDDTLPILEATLLDAAGAAVNLTGTTVTFIYSDPAGAVTSNAATIVTPLTGEVSYTFTAAQTAAAGFGQGEFSVDFGGGSVQTFPTEENIVVQIHETLTV